MTATVARGGVPYWRARDRAATGDVAPGAGAAWAPAPRPRMRGWLHAYAAAVSVVAGATLAVTAARLRGTAAGLSTSLYAVTVVMLFAVSASYHR
ncbi:MAG: hypothetical protein LBQ06_03550, partial [Frankiaceae bacterium]|nr:hypothetical protein [Frankiaceae bacterium]